MPLSIKEAVEKLKEETELPEDKIREKIKEQTKPQAEDQKGREWVKNVLKIGGPALLAAVLGFRGGVAHASTPSGTEITGEGLSHVEKLVFEDPSTGTDKRKIIYDSVLDNLVVVYL